MNLNFKQICQVIKNFAIEIPMEILAFFIVPIALLFCKKDSENLPRWARWFDDPDYGINGDDGWRGEHYPNGKNRTYWARTRFLLRNRIGVFSAKFLGVKVADIDASSVSVKGDPLITYNKGEKSSFCLVTCKIKDGKQRFGYYREIRYGKSKWYCRIYIGWKLMDIAKMRADNKESFMQADDKKALQSVWAINPFKKIKEL